MSLGFFIFSLPTLAYQELQRQTKWRFAETGVVGVRPRQQFIGLGSDDITLRGELRLEVAGKSISLDYLRSFWTKIVMPLCVTPQAPQATQKALCTPSLHCFTYHCFGTT